MSCQKQQYNKGLLPLSYEELLQVSEKTLTLTEKMGKVPTVSKRRPQESRLGPDILKACFQKEETVAELLVQFSVVSCFLVGKLGSGTHFGGSYLILSFSAVIQFLVQVFKASKQLQQKEVPVLSRFVVVRCFSTKPLKA